MCLLCLLCLSADRLPVGRQACLSADEARLSAGIRRPACRQNGPACRQTRGAPVGRGGLSADTGRPACRQTGLPVGRRVPVGRQALPVGRQVLICFFVLYDFKKKQNHDYFYIYSGASIPIKSNPVVITCPARLLNFSLKAFASAGVSDFRIGQRL